MRGIEARLVVAMGAFVALVATAAGTSGVGAAPPRPQLTVTPGQGTPAMTVRASGSGFCGGSGCGPIRITFAGVAVANNVQSAPDGNFTVGFQPIGGAPGEKVVEATQTGHAGEPLMATTSFTLLLLPAGASKPPAVVSLPVPRPSALVAPSPAASSPAASSVPESLSPSETPGQSPSASAPVITAPPARAVRQRGGSELLPWLVGTFVLAAAGGCAWWIRRRRRPPPIGAERGE